MKKRFRMLPVMMMKSKMFQPTCKHVINTITHISVESSIKTLPHTHTGEIDKYSCMETSESGV